MYVGEEASRGAAGECNCAALKKIESVRSQGEGMLHVEDLISIPNAAHGYIDPDTGKQLGSFMTYVIKFNDGTVRRRYSDFELLVTHLCRVYPTHIIPPIPAKQSVASSITSMFGRSAEAQHLIDHRVRSFSNFLRHVLTHPVLFKDHPLHMFISAADASWKMEIVKYRPLLLKSLPGNKFPKTLDKSLSEVHEMLLTFEEHAKDLDLSQKSMLRRVRDIQGSLEALGTAYNSFSLEFGPLSTLLDGVGEIHDSDATTFAEVAKYQELVCELVHEIPQFTASIRRAIRNYAARLLDSESNTEQINTLRSGILQDSDRIASIDLPALEEAQNNLDVLLTRNRQDLLAEIGIWLDILRVQWRQVLKLLASAEKIFSEQSLEMWSSLAIKGMAAN